MEVMTIHKVSSPTSKHCNQSQKPEEETQCAAADPGNNVIDQLTKQEIADFKKAFSLLDKDHDGVINVKDLGIVMKSLGMNPTDTELKEILSDADTENGVICFKDFLSMMTESEISSKEVDEAFKLFDEDGDGLITAADIHRILTCLGENPTKAMVDKLISEADSDGDGCVNYEEFVMMMISEPSR